jgi:hypothetical protein
VGARASRSLAHPGVAGQPPGICWAVSAGSAR